MITGLLAARRCDRLLREGNAKYHKFDMAGAEPLFRQAMEEAERSRQAGAVARAAEFLYFLLRRQQRYAEALPLLEQKVDAHRRIEGPDGRWTAEWRNELILLYGKTGVRDRLQAVCRERLESEVRRHGEASLEAALALVTLGWALRTDDRWDESEQCCRKALGLIEESCGVDHPRTSWAQIGLALALEHRGDLAGAEAALRRALDNWDRVGHADRVAAVQELLTNLYMAQGRHQEALDLSSTWFNRRRRGASLSKERELMLIARHAAVLGAVGREAEADRYALRARYLSEAIQSRRQELEAARERVGSQEVVGTRGPAESIVGPVFPGPLV